MTIDRAQLLVMSGPQLDELFRACPPGEIPDGDARGTALIGPGRWYEGILARMVRWFWWQGKIFDASRGSLVNKVGPVSLRAIKARVYKDASWVDGQEAIILDYSRTSLIAGKVRDEIRMAAPGLYFGPVFWGRTKLAYFLVEFHNPRGRWINPARAALLLLALLIAYGLFRFNTDAPVTYADIEDHFKYGSTGGERSSGIPYALWKSLPRQFPNYLPGPVVPGREYASLGFIYEDGKDLPIGVSMRNVQGLDRVFLNCAACHVGSVRETSQAPPQIILGMPSNTVDLQGLQRFFFACALDEGFTPGRVLPYTGGIEGLGGDLDPINYAALRFFGVGYVRERMLVLRSRFAFMDREPAFGPGRTDTFNPAKALLNFPQEKIPPREWVGLADLPSIWLQRPRKDMGMQLHWDGNNTSVEERNRSAAFGTGAFPPTLDRASLARVERWLLDKEPPRYPFPIDASLAARGRPTYERYCADCHGKDGRDFRGGRVGTVIPIDEIKTDRRRLDSYSEELAAAQNTLYAGYGDERFRHFRKTFGYANMPLDGVWLRAPYLHNGSVPTLRELLEPAAGRRKTFYRGDDVYDQRRVGFVADHASGGGRAYFLYDTDPTRFPGNGNGGHEGEEYGTDLPAGDKDALVEYLKTF